MTSPSDTEMATPWISIVIPLYNKERWIGETLESVRAQTYKDYEIIVVDDGSTDRGAEQALAFARGGSPLRVYSRSNAGVSAARNFGIDQARGQWTICLDADDLFEPDMLATLAQLSASYPSTNMLATSFRRHDPTASIYGRRESNWRAIPEHAQPQLIVDLPRRLVGGGVLVHVCSTAVRTRVLRALQPCFPPGEKLGEDTSFLFRTNLTEPLAWSPRRLLRYREGTSGGLLGSATTADFERFWARLSGEFAASEIADERRRSVDRFIAKTRTLRARDLLAEGEVDAAARMLASVGRPARDVFWWRTRLAVGLPGLQWLVP